MDDAKLPNSGKGRTCQRLIKNDFYNWKNYRQNKFNKFDSDHHFEVIKLDRQPAVGWVKVSLLGTLEEEKVESTYKGLVCRGGGLQIQRVQNIQVGYKEIVLSNKISL